MSDESILIAIVIILIVVIVWLLYREKKSAPSSPPPKDDGIEVMINGKPVLIHPAALVSYLKKLKGDIVKIYASVSSLACKTQLLPQLKQLSQVIEAEIVKGDGGAKACSSMSQLVTSFRANADTTKTAALAALKGIGASTDDPELESLFADMVENLEIVIHIVLARLCTPAGRINLDYIKTVLDRVGDICDIKVQTRMIEPNVDMLMGETAHILEGDPEPGMEGMEGYVPKYRVKPKVHRPQTQSSDPNAIEVVARESADTMYIPGMMKQIDRDIEGGTDNTFDRSFAKKATVSHSYKPPVSAIRFMAGSRS
jgi:hypothetical protein